MEITKRMRVSSELLTQAVVKGLAIDEPSEFR